MPPSLALNAGLPKDTVSFSLYATSQAVNENVVCVCDFDFICWSVHSSRNDSAALPSIRRRAASSGGIASAGGSGDVRPSKLKARSSKAAQISAQARIDKMRAVYGIQRENEADANSTDGSCKFNG